MSDALYNIESLRFYDEAEIELRNMMTQRIASTVKRTLLRANPAWKFFQVEGPILTPRNLVSSSYDENDIFVTQIEKANEQLVLRPETTVSSYTAARTKYAGVKLPACVWQLGKSFRVEKSDGATAAKLRFNEFYQLEFQCIYSVGTKADYRSYLMDDISQEISMFLFGESYRHVESDRLPSYSESTLDIEMPYRGDWKEVASCSIRTDYSEDTRVAEIAIGMDRLIEIHNEVRSSRK
jgi:glycyl-tRNA synthetase